jgi:hypothetical protein
MIALLLSVGCLEQTRNDRIPDAGQNKAIHQIQIPNTTSIPESSNRSTPLTEKTKNQAGNYVFLEHLIHTEGRTISGDCGSGINFDGPTYSFDEKNGVLNVYLPPDYRTNESLKLFYASGYSANDWAGTGARTSAMPVYLFPQTFLDGVTLDSVTEEGIVHLRYQNNTITIKPKERLIFNTTREIQTHPCRYRDSGCMEEVVTTDSFYNAGFFEKQKIKATYSS